LSVESEALEWLKNSLYMNIRGIGPNVYAYSVDYLTEDLMPALTITLDSVEATEASTATKNIKRATFSVGIHVVNKSAFWSIKLLCDIREMVTQTLEAMETPSSVIDFKEEGAGAFEANQELQFPIVSQSITYSFLLSEVDY